jgi:hypothetical protein
MRVTFSKTLQKASKTIVSKNSKNKGYLAQRRVRLLA